MIVLRNLPAEVLENLAKIGKSRLFPLKQVPMTPLLSSSSQQPNSSRIRPKIWTFLLKCPKIGPRKDHRGVDLVSDALPFGRLWYPEPDAVANALSYPKHRSRPPHCLYRVSR